MLVLSILLAAMSQPAAVIDEAGTITVTASRLPELEAAALACAAAPCGTRNDVAVTVAYASALFDNGRYLEAKRLLAAAEARQRKAAKAEPIAVATLYQAQATLAMHEGDQDLLERATWRSATTLQDALPSDAAPRLAAEFRLADWQYRVGQLPGALARYEDIDRRARASGQAELAAATMLRRASIRYSQGRKSEGAALLDTLAADPAQREDIRRAALAMRAALAGQFESAAAAATAEANLLIAGRGREPLLIHNPKLPQIPTTVLRDPTTIPIDPNTRGSDIVGLRWVDIGYRILPDGSVSDVAILRGSARTGWAAPLLSYVAARRYAPFSAGPGGQCRIDRYTLTANYSRAVGSLVRRRARNPRYEPMAMGLPGECS